MAVVELLLPSSPEHVRTARLVVVAAARRAGLGDATVDELRLAVGEACARAVGLHRAHAPEQRVAITVTDDPTGLAVAVTDAGPPAGPAVDDVAGGFVDDSDDGGDDGGDEVAPDLSLALLAGLVDDVEVGSADRGTGTTVTLRWPLPPRVPGGPPSTAAAPQ